MSFSEKFVSAAKWLLPSPFTIAVLLTFLTVLLALLFGESNNSISTNLFDIATHWQNGFWSLLTFTIQMMLILVLGYVLALSKPIDQLISALLKFCNNTTSAAFFISFFTILVALVNWGLGLIFGAIFARKMADKAIEQNLKINYPLIGATGYCGLMVWHGGFSGSAPVTIASAKHPLVEQMGVLPISETVFSLMNIVVSILLITIIPLVFYWIGRKTKPTIIPASSIELPQFNSKQNLKGAEKLDHYKWLAYLFGGIIIFISIWKGITNEKGFLANLSLNYINFTLFGLGLIFHSNIHKFITAFEKAIGSSAGIMLQFPLYAGIIGIMKGTGLIEVFSNFFVQHATATTFPVVTFISAAIVNVFVPSGGGQWAVQGPIIIDASQKLGLPLYKGVMALAYGDQLTNMLQPFWALPLLGITGLKAKDILPYTLLIMLIGAIIFLFALLVF